MDTLALHEGAAAAFRLIDATNEFIADTAPWTLAKNPANRDRLAGVLFDAAEAVRLAAALLPPFMPGSTLEILRRFGAPDAASVLAGERRWVAEGVESDRRWPPALAALGKGRCAADDGASRYDRQASDRPERRARRMPPWTLRHRPRLRRRPAPATAAPEADKISIDDFMKVELRTAKVLSAERVPKSSRC